MEKIILKDKTELEIMNGDGKIHVTFGIRQKTEMELAIEQLQRQQAETNASQEIQDGAIIELAGMVGGEA